MKLHFKTKATINSLPPKINPVVTEDKIIYYSSSHIHIVSISENKVLKKLKFEDVQIIKIHKSKLYICTNEINIFDLETNEITETIKLSKAIINKIEFHGNEMIISKINNRISYYSNFLKIFEFTVMNFCENVFLNENFFGCYDFERLIIYHKDNSKFFEKKMDGIIGVRSIGNMVFVLKNSGKILELVSNQSFETGLDLEMCHMMDEFILATNGLELYELSYFAHIIKTINIVDMISEYSKTYDNSYIDNFEMIKDLMHVPKPNQQIKKIKVSCSELNNMKISSSISDADTQEFMEDIETDHSLGTETDDLNNIESQMDLNSESMADDDETESQVDENLDSMTDMEGSNDIKSQMSHNSDSIPEDDDFELDEKITNSSNYDDNNDILEGNCLNISFLDKNYIKTSDNDVLLLKHGKVFKIFSFLDNVSASVEFDNHLILATSSGCLKYTFLSTYCGNFEYILDSKILKVSTGSITTAKVYNNFLFIGTNQKFVQVFKLKSKDSDMFFDLVFEIKCFRAPISALDIYKNVLAISSVDNVLHIFKSQYSNFNDYLLDKSIINSEVKDDILYISTFENISTQVAHSKAINHISITNHHIITSSSDKTSKVFDQNGILVKTIQSDKILNTCWSNKYIAVCSHKAIKVYHNSSLNQLAVFQLKKPVLSSYIYNNYILAVTDVLRIYDVDKKKCVKSYDLGFVNCWSFNYPFLCAENKIVILEDSSQEVYNELTNSIRELKQQTILIDKYLHEKRYQDTLYILMKKNDSQRIRETIIAGYNFHQNLSFLENIMNNGEYKQKIFDCFIKNPSFKNSELFNNLVFDFYHCKKDKKFDKERINMIGKILKKHLEGLEDLFVDFSGLQIITK